MENLGCKGSYILAPFQGHGPSLREVLFVKVWAGQGRDSATLVPLSLVQLLAFSFWELWLGRMERQLELLQTFLGSHGVED